MQLRQLKYFVAVVEKGSISLAAESLFVSQPAISQAIKSLEQELGFPLLHRKSDGIVCTAIGEIVYRDVSQIIQVLEHKSQDWKELHRLSQSCSDTVRIGCSCDTWHIAQEASKRIREFYPKLRLRFTEGKNDVLMAALEEDKLDLILSDYLVVNSEQILSRAEEKGIHIENLFRDQYRVAIAADNPAAADMAPSEDELRQLPLARLASGDEAYDLLFSSWFDPRFGVEVNSFEKMLSMTQKGQAASVLPVNMSRSLIEGKELSFFESEGFSADFVYMLAWKTASHSHGLAAAAHILKSCFDSMTGKSETHEE